MPRTAPGLDARSEKWREKRRVVWSSPRWIRTSSHPGATRPLTRNDVVPRSTTRGHSPRAFSRIVGSRAGPLRASRRSSLPGWIGGCGERVIPRARILSAIFTALVALLFVAEGDASAAPTRGWTKPEALDRAKEAIEAKKN